MHSPGNRHLESLTRLPSHVNVGGSLRLSFYEVNTAVEQHLYDMFMDYRMKTFQGAFHINTDYTTWYGYAKMKQALAEIKELDHQMREWAAAADAS